MIKNKNPQLRVTVDDVAFYYAKNCKVMPQVYALYIDGLTTLEKQGKICFTPEAILERYTINLKKRFEERARKAGIKQKSA